MIVDLEWTDVSAAAHEAVNRAINAKSKGIRGKHGVSEAFFDGLRIDVLGCLGELAYAKGLNRYWTGERGMHVPDVAGCIEVKTVDSENKHLFVLMDDAISLPPVSALAHVETATRVRLVGWTFTEAAKQEKNIFEARPGHPVYRVLRKDLRPIRELARMLAEREFSQHAEAAE